MEHFYIALLVYFIIAGGQILNIALFIVTDKLHKTWKINPLMKFKRYELYQMFVSKFELGVNKIIKPVLSKQM